MHNHQALPPPAAAPPTAAVVSSTAPRPTGTSLATGLPTDVQISHSSRFSVPASREAAERSRSIIRNVLPLILGADPQAGRTVRYAEACLAELVAAACARTSSEHLLCEVRADSEHVFLAVEHESKLVSTTTDQVVLPLVESLADDHGTHVDATVHHTWAAVRRN
ncbi:hypothetical protein [Streptomyces virginiae]|uniref:hypothetical protein n=1 Tax=Streptomyces virginiae TaxID=1961 RepID=UPI00365B7BDB